MEIIKNGKGLENIRFKFEYTNRWFENRHYYSHKKSPEEAIRELFGLKDSGFKEFEIKDLEEYFKNDNRKVIKLLLKLAKVKTRKIEKEDNYNHNDMENVINLMSNSKNELEVVNAFYKFIVKISKYRDFMFGDNVLDIASIDHNNFCSEYWNKVDELGLDLD